MLNYILYVSIYLIIGLIISTVLIISMVRKAFKMGYSVKTINDVILHMNNELYEFRWWYIFRCFIWPITFLKKYKELKETFFDELSKTEESDIVLLKAMKKILDKGSK